MWSVARMRPKPTTRSAADRDGGIGPRQSARGERPRQRLADEDPLLGHLNALGVCLDERLPGSVAADHDCRGGKFLRETARLLHRAVARRRARLEPAQRAHLSAPDELAAAGGEMVPDGA